DVKLKYYHLLGVLTAIALVLQPFFAAITIPLILILYGFGMLSLGALVHFLERNFQKQTLILPLFYLALVGLYITITLLFTKMEIPLPHEFTFLIQIIFSSAMIVYCLYMLFLFRR
ncbi:MAG: hypothetical protein ACMXYF_04800, partial [Candidatus Woesearchaeota archaeon]